MSDTDGNLTKMIDMLENKALNTMVDENINDARTYLAAVEEMSGYRIASQYHSADNTMFDLLKELYSAVTEPNLKDRDHASKDMILKGISGVYALNREKSDTDETHARQIVKHSEETLADFETDIRTKGEELNEFRTEWDDIFKEMDRVIVLNAYLESGEGNSVEVKQKTKECYEKLSEQLEKLTEISETPDVWFFDIDTNEGDNISEKEQGLEDLNLKIDELRKLKTDELPKLDLFKEELAAEADETAAARVKQEEETKAALDKEGDEIRARQKVEDEKNAAIKEATALLQQKLETTLKGKTELERERDQLAATANSEKAFRVEESNKNKASIAATKQEIKEKENEMKLKIAEQDKIREDLVKQLAEKETEANMLRDEKVQAASQVQQVGENVVGDGEGEGTEETLEEAMAEAEKDAEIQKLRASIDEHEGLVRETETKHTEAMEQLKARHTKELSSLQQKADKQKKDVEDKTKLLEDMTTNLKKLRDTNTEGQEILTAETQKVEEAEKKEREAKDQLEQTKKDIETLKASQANGLVELTETQEVYKQRLKDELNTTVATLRQRNLQSETRIAGTRNACIKELDEAKKELAKKEDEAKKELAKKEDEAKIELAIKEKAETDARIEASMHSFIHAIKYLNELKARIEMAAGKTGKEETDVDGEGATTVEAPITAPDNVAEGGGHELNRGKRTLKKSRYTGGKRIRRGGSRMNRRTLQRRKFRMRGGGNTTFDAISTKLGDGNYSELMSATNEDEDDNNKIKVFRKYYVGLARQFADIYYSSLFTQKDKEVSTATENLKKAEEELDKSSKALEEMDKKNKAAGSKSDEDYQAELKEIRFVWEEAKRQLEGARKELTEQQEKAATATEVATLKATEDKDAAAKEAADKHAEIQTEIQALQVALDEAETAKIAQLATAGVADTKALAEATAMKAKADVDVAAAQGEVAAAKAEVAKITAELEEAQQGNKAAVQAGESWQEKATLALGIAEAAEIKIVAAEQANKAAAILLKTTEGKLAAVGDVDKMAAGKAAKAVAAAKAEVANITAELDKARQEKTDAETAAATATTANKEQITAAELAKTTAETALEAKEAELEKAKKANETLLTAAASDKDKDKQISNLIGALESYKYMDSGISMGGGSTGFGGGGIYRGGGEISESRRKFLEVLLNKLDGFQSFDSSSDSSSDRGNMIAATVYILFGGFTLDTGYTKETVEKLVTLFISSIGEGIKNKLPQKFTRTEADVQTFLKEKKLSLAEDKGLDPNRVNFEGPKRNTYLEELRIMNREIGKGVNDKVLKFAALLKQLSQGAASLAPKTEQQYTVNLDEGMEKFYTLFNEYYEGGDIKKYCIDAFENGVLQRMDEKGAGQDVRKSHQRLNNVVEQVKILLDNATDRDISNGEYTFTLKEEYELKPEYTGNFHPGLLPIFGVHVTPVEVDADAGAADVDAGADAVKYELFDKNSMRLHSPLFAYLETKGSGGSGLATDVGDTTSYKGLYPMKEFVDCLTRRKYKTRVVFDF